jgi:hypothetical protein
MAGRGSGDVQAGGSGPDEPVPEAGPADPPAQILRSWDAAEARLFPLIMARPEEYERSLTLIQVVLGWLRSSSPDIPALLAESARGEAIVADAAGRLSRHRGEPRQGTDDAGGGGPDHQDLVTGAGLDLIAAAACAMRYRELMAARAARGRLAAIASARARRASWAVVEEAGDEARAPYLPYQRVEAHVPSGRAVIISIEPDETLSRPVWRLDEAVLDLAGGRLVIGGEIGSYASAEDFDNALASARLRLS